MSVVIVLVASIIAINQKLPDLVLLKSNIKLSNITNLMIFFIFTLLLLISEYYTFINREY